MKKFPTIVADWRLEEEERTLVNKIRLIFLVMLLIPQGIIYWMASDSLLTTNKNFSQIEAVSLASALLLILGMPSLTIQWLVEKPLRNMRELCSQVKGGNYHKLLPLSSEGRDGEDEMVALMRDMNWMARQIEKREKDLQQAVDDLWQSRNQMQVMAMTDPLTAIANRRCFFDTLEQKFKALVCQYQPISLLIIDVDFFKKINDTYGHQIGDQVLLELAKIIQDNTRGGDLVARIGGEEYGILLPNNTSQEAISVANRIQKGIDSHEFLLDANRISVTVSIGVCTLPQPPCCFDKEKLYNYADQALYHSKNSGRNSVSVYDPDNHSIQKVA